MSRTVRSADAVRLPRALFTRIARALVLPALALLSLLPACTGDFTGSDTAAGPASSAPAPAPGVVPRPRLDLAVTVVHPEPFTVTVTVPGTIRGNQDKTAMVVPIIEGRISAVLVDWGDDVEQGQLLATLESVAVGEAKAAHFEAMADLDVAEARLTRMETLAKDKIVATKDLTAARAERISAKASEDASERALHVIGFTEEEIGQFGENHDLTSSMPIVAPLSGTIVKRDSVLGAWAAPPDALFTIMDLRHLWVDAEVYEKDLSKVRKGQRVSVSVVAYPGKTFTGRVIYVGDTLDDEKRTAVVRTELDNADRALKPGMFCTARILTLEKKDALVLPEGAVFEGEEQPYVVIEQAGRHELRSVQVGSTSGGLVEIHAGLSFGDHVLTGGHAQIAAALKAAGLFE